MTLLTNWFPVGIAPERDGCYIVRTPHCDCWHFCRWECLTGNWYSAGSKGVRRVDRMGWSADKDSYERRGLAQEPKQ